jgi:serine/threonine protein kinase
LVAARGRVGGSRRRIFKSSKHDRRGPDDRDPAVGTGLGSRSRALERHDAIPEAIGPYRLIEVLGQGGFGVVYRAEQHRPLRREVALKVIKPGMDARTVSTRVESERQALAVMNHPCIAKVVGADGDVSEAVGSKALRNATKARSR